MYEFGVIGKSLKYRVPKSNPTTLGISRRLNTSLASSRYRNRLLLITNVPAPYRVPIWNHLERLADNGINVVFTTSSWSHRSWSIPAKQMKFDWQFLAKGSRPHTVRGEIRIASALCSFLIRAKPAAIICGGYDTLAAWIAFAWCRLFGKRFVLWLESNARDCRRINPLKTWLKEVIVSKSDAIAAPGKAALEYAKTLGARESRVSIVRNGFDVDAFARGAERINSAQERNRRGLPAKVILFAGRLIRLKGVFVLLEAFRRVSAECMGVGLLIVGHGTEELAMQEFCRSSHVDNVHFEGPQPYERMPYYYALADVMVLPTFSDPHPLSVGEAFACGTPVIVSRVAGAADDLIIQGETGYTVEPGDVADLADKILRLLKDPQLVARMRRNCRQLIITHTADYTARELYRIACQARDVLPRTPSENC